MDGRKDMSVDEFDLLVRALHRVYAQNPKNISIKEKSLFYSTDPMVHIYDADSAIWITLGEAKYTVKTPGFWDFTEKNKFRQAKELINDMVIGVRPLCSTEELICKYV